MSNPSRASKVAAYALTAALGLALTALVWYSRLLRPLADDYWYAALLHEHGFVGALQHWGSNYGNMYSKESVLLALIATPLLYLPWALASALPFWLGIACVVAAVRIATGPLRAGRTGALLVGAAAISGWSLYWWASLATLNEKSVDYAGGYRRDLGLLLTHYQTGTLAYLPLAVLALGMGVRFLRVRDGSRSRLMWAVPLGIVLGFGNYTQSALIGVLCAVVATLAWLGRAGLNRRDVGPVVAFATTMVGTVIATMFMPGTAARNEALASRTSLPAVDPLGEVVVRGLDHARELLVSPSSVLLLGFAALIGMVLATLTKVDSRRFLKTGTLLGAVATLSVLLNAYVDNKAQYSPYAPWHLSTAGLLAFCGVFLVGLAAGAVVQQHASAVARLLALSLGVLCVLGGLWSVRAQCRSIEYRHSQWVKGPAPVVPIVDIEYDNQDDLIPWGSSWKVVAEARGDAPDRAFKLEGTLRDLIETSGQPDTTTAPSIP